MALSLNILLGPGSLSNSQAFFAPYTNHTPKEVGMRFIVQPCVPRVTQLARFRPAILVVFYVC